MRTVLAELMFLTWFTGSVQAQEAKPLLQPREPWTNLLADQDVALQFSVASDVKGRLTWTFAAANGRVYDRGRGEAKVPGGGKPVKVTLRTPPLNPGVVQEAKLTVSLIADGKELAGAGYEKTIWVFPADPFADRHQWLARLRIKLYDPAAPAKTTALFKELKIPFEEVPRLAGLAEVHGGVIIIGEGASLQEEPDLMPALLRAATRGVRVVCLAPATGSFVVPGTLPDAAPGILTLARQDVIGKLDKRLDSVSWPPAGSSVGRSLALKAEEGKVVAEITPGAKGWSWLAVDFPQKKGRLVVSCFSMIDSWQASPTPRYLLARILENLED
jgi:hypothetical protein